jgi:hypothetical protein
MMLQSIKSKVVSGLTQLSELVLMGGTFAVVIGCPYSDQVREAGSWLGVALVTGLTVYAIYQIVSCSKTIFTAVLPQVYRLPKIPGDFIQAVHTGWPRIWSSETSKACNLRLPPDIFFRRGEVGIG